MHGKSGVNLEGASSGCEPLQLSCWRRHCNVGVRMRCNKDQSNSTNARVIMRIMHRQFPLLDAVAFCVMVVLSFASSQVEGTTSASATQRGSTPEPQLEPPCGSNPNPAYPRLADSPNVKSWGPSELGPNWRPPPCTGWSAPGFTTLVTTVARFGYNSDHAGLLRRFGAVSEFAGIRYWSTTHKQWKTLVLEAYALTSQNGQHR